MTMTVQFPSWGVPARSVRHELPPAKEDTHDDPPAYRDSATRATRRWPRVVGLVAALVLLLLIVARLVGGGAEHGPARHIGATQSLNMEV